MNTERPLGGSDIRRLLNAVAGALGTEGPQHTIVIVGGALLALHGMRAATHDVDSIRRIDAELREAVADVASDEGLAPEWLNDSAAAFWPQTLEMNECDLLLNAPRLRVLGAPLRDVFVMKVHAARDVDRDDLVAMWPMLNLTPEAAVELFWSAYPTEPDDEYLIDWIRGIARQADRT